MNIDITNPIFHDEAKATAHIEAQRWNGEPVCPHCGSLKVRKMGGKTQKGMFLCNDCRDKFTVRTGTVMERSHVPLHKWLLATHLLAASKKGMSAKQIEHMLGAAYKTSWPIWTMELQKNFVKRLACSPFTRRNGPVST